MASELILGGQRSGKSARAETLAIEWLAGAPERQAVFIATAQAWDDEMRARIVRHQADRAERLPGMRTVEVSLALADALVQHSQPQVLVVVDCLTLWLTHLLMPPERNTSLASSWPQAPDASLYRLEFLRAIEAAPGPVVIVSNEIGLGVIPMGAEVRAYVDALGRLNQQVAAVCQRVTLMAAGLPLNLKGGA